MPEKRAHRGYLATIFGCYCPRCREGKLFRYGTAIGLKRNMEMYAHCPQCGQVTDIEVGFYYGTGYISYFLCIAFSLITLLLWWLLIGFSFDDHRFFFWVGFNAALLLVLQPWLMRFSRAFWLSCFVSYDPDWRIHEPEVNERTNPEQMNNW